MVKRAVRYLAAVVPLLIGTHAWAGQPLPNFNAYYSAKPANVTAGAAGLLPALPLALPSSMDDQRGVPTFLWAIRNAPGNTASALAGLTPEAAALIHLQAHAPRYGLTPAALATAAAVRVLDVGRGGITVVMRQRIGGVEVWHNDVKVLMDRSLALVAIGGNLHAGAVPTPKIPAFSRSEAQAVAAAFNDRYGVAFTPKDLVDLKRTKADYHYYDLAPTQAVKASAIRLVDGPRVRRIYFPLPDRIVPAYYVGFIATNAPKAQSDAYAYVFAADDGRMLYRENLTHDVAFNYRVWADTTGDKRPADGPLADYSPHPTGTPDGTYPGPVAPSLVSIDGFNKFNDPWLPATATQTVGNNVDAYTDDAAPEGYNPPNDTRANTTSANTFDHTYNLTLGPQANLTQKQAAVTDMFYETNWLHDWWYDSGFDEAGGNAQTDNLGRGGVAGDALHAEGQYGAPTNRNNSNMSVPADGMSPRMHMFVWDGKGNASLTVQPGNLTPVVGVAGFGPQTFGPTMGSVVAAVAADACTPLTNAAAVNGHIAIVDRGTCTFKAKTLNAQNAGAIGVIVSNNVAGAPFTMGDDPMVTTTITIPAMMVSQADGTTIKGLAGATATMSRSAAVDLDGTIDNNVIGHEWGHYLHLRHVACGNQQCGAQSEGWADFDAQMLQVRQGDNLGGTYSIGTYAVAAFPDDPGYFGIRRYPYSIDLVNKSPLTFKYITDGVALPMTAPLASGNAGGNNSEVHAAGEIWCAMLWEGYESMLAQTQGASPPYTFDQGRRRMSDYVVGGMTMAPTDPTYTEQRDGVLAAAAAADVADLTLLAQGFAKRGAGTCAVSPPRTSTTFAGVVEDFNLEPNITIASVTVDDSVVSCDGSDGYLDGGETGKVTVKLMNTGVAPLANATATLASTTPGITFPNGPMVTFGNVAAFGAATGSAEIKLDVSMTTKENLALTVTVNGVAGCGPVTLNANPYLNVEATPSATDDVEASTTAWTTTGTNAGKIWSRTEVMAPNHVWAGIDYGSPSDTSLVSPALDVSTTQNLVLSFDHAHSFENSMNVNWDGAVIELSTDGGATWNDIAMYGNPGYGGTIGDPMNMAMNVLKGRQGYVATNPSYPATDHVTIDMGNKLAGKTIQVRFRIGTDDAQGDVGWQLDNIGFQGITNTPFLSLVADPGDCSVGTSSSSSSTGTGTGGAPATASASSTSSTGGTGGVSGTGGAPTSASSGFPASGSGGSSNAGGASSGTGGGTPNKPGGCGCATAGDPAGGTALSALGLAALALRRRRRTGR